jgi:hypothetical protein
MSHKGSKIGQPHLHEGLSADETPMTSVVSTGEPERVAGSERSDSQQPGPSRRIRSYVRTGVAGVLVAAMAASSGKKGETPKAPPVRSTKSASPGGSSSVSDSDPCGPDFSLDATAEELASSAGHTCEFITEGDHEIIVGHVLIDADGVPRDCYLSPVWSSNTALKVRGQIEGNVNDPGRIFMRNGKLCVTMLDDGHAEMNVPAEASVNVVTTGRTLLKIDEEARPSGGTPKRFLLVHPVSGEALITQDGRPNEIRLAEGDTPVRIPLNVEQIKGGCYIAKAGKFASRRTDEGLWLITAGTIFLALRRRKRSHGR